MERGDIYLVSFDSASEQEQQGMRLVVVVTPSAFNDFTQAPIVLPIAGGAHPPRITGFTVSLTGAGTHAKGVIRCDQPRALDIKARNGRKLERVPQNVMDDVLAKLAAILE